MRLFLRQAAARERPDRSKPGRIAMAGQGFTARFRLWHAACDSTGANGREPFAARQQKDIAMHTSPGAVATRPLARRLLGASAGLALGLAAALPAAAQDTIKV